MSNGLLPIVVDARSLTNYAATLRLGQCGRVCEEFAEAGLGKQLLARAIAHDKPTFRYSSGGSHRPFDSQGASLS